MNENELNEFIINYVKREKTQSALMLSGQWGIGKSYYINNSLKENLKKNDFKMISVSLYGLTSIHDISKSIYIELKLLKKKHSKKAKHAVAGIALAGKTVIKGVASFFNVDLSIDQNALDKFFKTVNLSKTLIVLEDLERTTLNFSDLLGYINNLTEIDGAKVLLVSNEAEILSSNEWKDEYLRQKEKTISDTLTYVPNIFDVIDKITIEQLTCKNNLIGKDSLFGCFKTTSILVDEISKNKDLTCNFNFRSIIFAIEKVNDICLKIDSLVDEFILTNLICSMTIYCLKLKAGVKMSFPDNDDCSSSLGTSKYPLYKFAYDYIIHHSFSEQEAKETVEKIKANLSAKEKNVKLRNLLENVYSYSSCNERTIVKDIEKILIDLKKESDFLIPVSEYRILANYLIAIKSLGISVKEINECKKAMIKKVKTVVNAKDHFFDSYTGISFDSQTAANEFNEFISKMDKILETNRTINKKIIFKEENLEQTIDELTKIKDKFITAGCFAKNIDLVAFKNIMNSKQSELVETIRSLFHRIYSFSNLYQFFKKDLPALRKIKKILEDILVSNKESDKIYLLQIKYFISNVNDFISIISR